MTGKAFSATNYFAFPETSLSYTGQGAWAASPARALHTTVAALDRAPVAGRASNAGALSARRYGVTQQEASRPAIELLPS